MGFVYVEPPLRALSFTSTDYEAQTFTIGNDFENVDFILTSVKVYLTKSFDVGTITAEIYAVDANGKPTGTAISSGTRDADDVPNVPAVDNIEFTMSECNLYKNTKYALVLHSSGGSGSNACYWKAAWSADQNYSGGTECDSSDSGVTWSTGGYWDCVFEIWGKTFSGQCWNGVSGAQINIEGVWKTIF